MVLLTIATVVVAAAMLASASGQAKRTGTSQMEQFTRIEHALASFVAANKRLPCPADGSLLAGDANRGKELRDTTTQICTSATAAVADQKTGIVPWVTLGLPESDVTSADLTYYSFRVFSGPKGLTQDNGADMSPCDTDNTPNADAALGTNGLCESVKHDNTLTQFLLGKGLAVVNDTMTINGVAYAVIHHGVNAKGAFLSSGTRNPLPNATNIKEYANTLGTDSATYTATYNATTPNILPDTSDDNYFDDRVAYLTILDLAKKAGLAARNWPDNYLNPARTANMTLPSTDPSNPHFESTGSGDTAFQAVTLGDQTTLLFGAGSGTYAGCLWWPLPVSIAGGTTKYRWSMYSEFSLENHPGDPAPGFTIGLLSAIDPSMPPTNTTCGGTGSGALGWSGGTLATIPNRVAVEVDSLQSFSSADPADTHMAIDYGGTRHGISAEACTSPGYGKGCDQSGSSAFLSEDGLTTYHSLRMDVAKGCTLITTGTGTTGTSTIAVGDQTDIGAGMTVAGAGVAPGATVTAVSGGNVTLSLPNTGNVSGNVTFISVSRISLQAWLLSNAGCTGNPALCDAMKNVDAPFSQDMTGNPQALHVKRCLALPTPANALDSFYFGITTANRDSNFVGAGANLQFRDLQTALRISE
jgi:hypothetical protein